MRRGFSWFNAVSLTFGFAFLYIPILLLVIYSFNDGRNVAVWAGWSTRWYVAMLNNQQLMDAAWVTFRIAALSATIATVLGTLAAVALVRMGRFRGRTLFSAMVFAPIVMPEVITGLSLLLLFVAINFDRGFWTIAIAHTTFSMCFVAVVVQSRLVTFDRSLEEAAMDLGCPPLRTFLVITLPIILPGVIAGWMLAFTLSLDDLVIASFTSGPGATTLPMRIYSACPPRRDARDQCRVDGSDRARDDRRHQRVSCDEAPGSQSPTRRTGGRRGALAPGYCRGDGWPRRSGSLRPSSPRSSSPSSVSCGSISSSRSRMSFRRCDEPAA